MTDEMMTDAIHLAEYICIHAESNLLDADAEDKLSQYPSSNIAAVPISTKNNRTKDIANKCKNFIARYKGNKAMPNKIPLTQVLDDFRQICIEENLDVYLDPVTVAIKFEERYALYVRDLRNENYVVVDDRGM